MNPAPVPSARKAPVAAAKEVPVTPATEAPLPTGNKDKKRKDSWFQRSGAFTISLLVHGIFIIVAIFFFYKWVYPPVPESIPDFVPGGGGGGTGGETVSKIQQQKKRMMTNTAVAKRITSISNTATFSIPASSDEMVDPGLPAVANSGGLGSGGGTGGGHGMGSGVGSGLGNGPGSGSGSGKGAIFGLPGASDRMSGYIYDLTHLKDGRPSLNMKKYNASDNCPWQDPLVAELYKDRFPESMLNKYYRGPEKLGVHQILIPCSKDITAPKAFGAEGKMSSGAWVIVYSARVRAPETGEIRFCGTADNYLGVNFDSKGVLYYASGAYSGIELSPTEQTGLRMPMAKGSWLKVEAGKWYDIDIAIGDAGGLFSAVLYYERKGDEKNKFLFRTKNIPWDEVLKLDGKVNPGSRDLPVDLNPFSPVWECKKDFSMGDF
ncbi:MAG: hypothetical protein ABIT37_25595 [Luteolibacter sp.]